MENNTTHISSTDTAIDKAPFEFLKEYKICYGHSKVGGRGVFATADIEVGELIERCPMVPLQNRSRYHTDQALWTYCYSKPLCDCAECKNHGFVFYLVLGHGMIYNHQDDHNADWAFNHQLLYADVIANRAIKKGSEIFVSYGSNYFNNREKILVTPEPINP